MAPFLFVSLVIPGTEAAPGTLVTFVIGPSGGAVPVGDASQTLVGDHPVVFEIGDVMVDVHVTRVIRALV